MKEALMILKNHIAIKGLHTYSTDTIERRNPSGGRLEHLAVRTLRTVATRNTGDKEMSPPDFLIKLWKNTLIAWLLLNCCNKNNGMKATATCRYSCPISSRFLIACGSYPNMVFPISEFPPSS